MWRGFVSVGVLVAVALSAGEASATVYTWTQDGIRHFTNSAGEVPDAHRDTVKSFPTTAATGTAAPTPGDERASTPDARHVAAEVHDALDVHEAEEAHDARLDAAAAYGRGVERGAELALAQTRAVGELALAETRAVGELARSLLETALHARAPAPPPAAPAREPEVARRGRRSPDFRVSIVPSRDRWPGAVFFGRAGPVAGCAGCCCAGGIGYGFGSGRLVPHSHFFPSLGGARRTSLFFPYGHQLDAGAFLVGRAFWVD